MQANGIARLGLGCAIALTSNLGNTTTVDEPRIVDFVADPAELSDAAVEWFELDTPAATPPDLNGLPPDAGDLQRIDIDLLIPPREYLTLARSTASAIDSGCLDASDSPGKNAPRDLPGKVLCLDSDRGPDTPGHGESPEPSGLAPSDGQTPSDLENGYADGDAPDSAGGAADSGIGLPGNAWLFVSALLALASPILLPQPGVEEPES